MFLNLIIKNVFRRKRRNALKASPEILSEEEEEENDNLENFLEVVRRQDVTGCGLRLVCELAQERGELYPEHEAILDIVG